MATLSIIIPVYNKEAYLDSCIESILGQTFSDFELILVNDGSTDGSEQKCDLHSKKDSRIKVIHQENRGVSAARNAGLALASGQCIGFVDSDDQLESDMYELLVNCLHETGADVAMCGVRKVYSDSDRLFYGTQQVSVFDKDEAISRLLMDRLLGSVYDKVYKRTAINNLQFEGRMYEDFYFNFLAFRQSSKVAFADYIKYHWLIRDNSVSMARFNEKFMETIRVSGKIRQLVEKEMLSHTEEAKAFDFHMNMWVYNLVLSTDSKQYTVEKAELARNLRQYRDFVKASDLVKKKYRYAYYLFQIAPVLYQSAISLYGKYANSEYQKRK